tara:strand:+ start:383 stop:1366 length:984 start_codon:yes stop_codon:yes gene_type:complete
MNNKIRVALIYKDDYQFLSGKHFDNTTYYFFMHALRRNKNLDVKYYPAQKKFDCLQLKNKTDIILLPINDISGTPDELEHIKELDIPVVSRIGDPHYVKKFNNLEFHEKWGIDYSFNFMHKDYFHQFYPKNFDYKEIIFGLEPNLYNQINSDYDNRIKNKILNSGAIGKSNIKSRVANKILNPKRSSWYFYKLRTMCNNLNYVIHARDLPNQNLSYQQHLSQYLAAIAATTFYPTIKYWETAGSGCLTFMEITKLNRGDYLGFQDGVNAIFINEKNYKQKFSEFLEDPNNPKWVNIAKEGQIFASKKFNNDYAVDNLVLLFTELLKK